MYTLYFHRGEEGRHRLEEREFEPSSAEDNEPLQQVFSVSSHPSLPILVFSDGYMVTFTQLPGDLSAFVFMRNLVLESSKHLKEVFRPRKHSYTGLEIFILLGGFSLIKACFPPPECLFSSSLGGGGTDQHGTLERGAEPL